MLKGFPGRAALASLIAMAAGCAGVEVQDGAREGAADEERSEARADALVPSWLRNVEAPFACGEAVAGTFAGLDSGHGYAVEAKAGRAYTFRFAADLTRGRGLALGAWDARGRRVASARDVAADVVELAVTPREDGPLTIGAYSVTSRADGAYTLRQVCEIPGQNAIAAGDSTFTHEEAREAFGRGFGLEAARTTAASDAPAGRVAEVKEADVYKLDGARLFYLSTYRGFVAYDLADPSAPRLLGRLPIYGQPVEMFVEGSTVFALVRDVLEATPRAGKLIFERKRTSRLVAIDVADPRAPRVLQSIDIEGDLEEGVSRKVGDVVYVVSQKRWTDDPQAHVYSFDVSNPRAVREAGRLELFRGGAYARREADGWESRSFDGVTLSATANTLHVVENWSVYESVYGAAYRCGRSQSLQRARVSVVDISDPHGAIRVHSRFETYGAMGDQFKQAYANGVYYGIFARREWASADCTGTSRVENTLEAWDLHDGAAPVKLDALPFGKPNETVRGSAFDLERGVVFAITAQNVDPLYAIDLSDPRHLAVKSAVDGLSGDMTLFRFVGDKKFLLGVGRDQSDACTGFDDAATGFASRIAASVIDVRDLANVRLVQRKCVTVKGANFVGSQISWDLDQAHKAIGMHSDGQVNALTVPVHYYADGESRTAVGLMAWDLGKYDPSKDEKHQTVLEGFGTVLHPAGMVNRSILFRHPVAERRELLALSNTHLSLTDLADLRAPRTDAVVEIAPYHARAFVVGGHVVEHVVPNADGGWSPEGLAELRVRPLAGRASVAPVASLRLTHVERVIQVGERLVVVTRDAQYKPFAKVVDLRAAAAPSVSAEVALPIDWIPYGLRTDGQVASFGWDDGSGAAVAGDRLVLLATEWTQAGGAGWKLVELDVSDPAAPVARAHALAAAEGTTYAGLVADGDGVLVGVRAKIGEKDVAGTTFDLVTYHAERWSAPAGAPLAKGPRLQVPGRVIAVRGQGRGATLVTADKTYEQTAEGGFRHNARLHLVARGATAAFELGNVRLAGQQLKEVAVDGSTLFVNAKDARSTFWWGPMFDARVGFAPRRAAVRANDELTFFDLSRRTLDLAYRETLRADDGAEIVAAGAGRLFLSLPNDGVLVVDARRPAAPASEAFVRTLGWTAEVTVAPAAQKAFVAQGHHGLTTLDLGR